MRLCKTNKVITSKEKENPSENAVDTNWEHGQEASSTLNSQFGFAQVTALAWHSINFCDFYYVLPKREFLL